MKDSTLNAFRKIIKSFIFQRNDTNKIKSKNQLSRLFPILTDTPPNTKIRNPKNKKKNTPGKYIRRHYREHITGVKKENFEICVARRRQRIFI